MGKCVFNDGWLCHKDYKDWIRRDSNKYKAFCHLCKKTIELGKMGEGALSSHQKSKKHLDVLKATKPAVPIANFLKKERTFPPSASQSTDANSVLCASTSAKTVTSFCTKSDVLKAEIIWTMKVVNSHYSFKSCEDIGPVFVAMFPDSKIAQEYKCAEGKTAYLATFGIAPYFLSLLKTRVKSESSYVLLFDESLNAEMQEKQLDVHVRIWDGDCVATNYLTSEFLGHAAANDLLDRLDPIVCEFGHRKLIQLSMDGPNVNWKLYRTLQDEIEKQSSCKMLQTGSCGLHIVHNAFRAGCTAAGWDLEEFLSSLHYLFHDAPARREDFKAVTGSSTFPLMFCTHRWVENAKAAERAILIIPQIVEYCTAAKSKKVTCPSCNSFTIVQKGIKDPLITAKLHFFLMVAREVEPFLKGYQTDKPMLPFNGQDLGLLLKGLISKFLKPDVMKQKSTSLSGLVKIDVSEKANWLEVSKVDVGFCAERQLIRSNLASERQKIDFKSACRDFLVATTKKVLEKAPVTYPLVRSLSWMDPRQMAKQEEQENNRKKLTRTLHILLEAGRVRESSCDMVVSQFSNLIDYIQGDSPTRTKFIEFRPDKDRVDTLLHSCVAGQKQYEELWGVMKQLLLLSHGQASVERGFSVNKEVTVENMSQKTLVAERLVVEHVRRAGGVEKVAVTKELLLSASSARSKYQQHLDDAKKSEAEVVRGQKRKAVEDKLAGLKTKKARSEEDIRHLRMRADKLSDEAERKSELALLIESNALRKKLKDIETSLPKLEKEIEDEMGHLKDLK